jgi:lincosamide nucleotidyltransferase A/C/D/E
MDTAELAVERRETTTKDILWLKQELETLGVQFWLNGGWGVDALLGKQTRPHPDVDLLIQSKDLPAIKNFFAEQGFSVMPRNDQTEWDFHLGDANGRELDIHGIIIDEQVGWKYADPREEDTYPLQALSSKCSIEGQEVSTLSPELMVIFHTGYELQEKDRQDVSALCAKFGIAVPGEYSVN